MTVPSSSSSNASNSRKLTRESLTAASSASSVLVLQNVSIPVAVVPFESITSPLDDDIHKAVISNEGLVRGHIRIQDGRITNIAIREHAGAVPTLMDEDDNTNSSSIVRVDCRRAIVMPCFVDCHTHLDKTMTVQRSRNSTGTMEEAWMQREPQEYPFWIDSTRDLERRMDFAVRCALFHGTKAIRTHLDGYDCGDDFELAEKLRAAVYGAYSTIQQRYRDQITIQGVANLYLPLYHTMPELARSHGEHAKRYPGTVLGAYIGNTADTPVADTVQHFDAMLQLAADLNLDIDLHIDESNDPRCCALKPLIQSLRKARQSGYQGKVVLGHCCALSLQDDETKLFICQELGKLGNVLVVANPFTNLSLQDRRGTKPPIGVEIPLTVPRTPQWRGLTLLQELRAAGVAVATASDNVRDCWLSHGSDYDMLSVWSTTLAICHLDTSPNEGTWADIVTTNPARAMGVLEESFPTEDHIPSGSPSSPFSIGQFADFILFPGARYTSELFSRPHNDRIVLRKGIVQDAALPDYAELDDLLLLQQEESMEEQRSNNDQGGIEGEKIESLLCQLLGLDNRTDTVVIEKDWTHDNDDNDAAFTQLSHIYQTESWDCGVTCLMMVSQWLQQSNRCTDVGPAWSTSPDSMAEKQTILATIKTESIWTSDVVWQLHQWKLHGDTEFTYAVVSKNLSSPDQEYATFDYYHDEFVDDHERVTRTFGELRRLEAPMLETTQLSLSVVIELVSQHENCIAIVLLDNSILKGKRYTTDATTTSSDNHSNSSSKDNNYNKSCNSSSGSKYAGHYVILCGTSNDPQHWKAAKDLERGDCVTSTNDSIDDTLEELDASSGWCCVLSNPEPSSPAPFMFVTPSQFERAWRSRGTDDDIIFVVKT